MKKICIYDVDSLPGGEVGIGKFLSQMNYEVGRGGVIHDQKGIVRGKITGGQFLSEDPTLELHVYDPVLERLIEEYGGRETP